MQALRPFEFNDDCVCRKRNSERSRQARVFELSADLLPIVRAKTDLGIGAARKATNFDRSLCGMRKEADAIDYIAPHRISRGGKPHRRASRCQLRVPHQS